MNGTQKSIFNQRISVIFLDIDGVLRPGVSLWHATFEKAIYAFSPIAVGLLNRLCYETGAEVVISSSWREAGTDKHIFEQINKALDALNSLIPKDEDKIPLYIRTFYRMPNFNESWRTPLMGDFLDRSREIDAWLQMWGHWVNKYCILDDAKCILSLHHHANLVWIERGDSGFDIDYYEKAMDILTDSLYWNDI